MGKIQIGVEIGGAGQRYVTVLCPECDATSRRPFETLAPGATLACDCGVGFNLSQKNYNDLRGYGLGVTSEEAN